MNFQTHSRVRWESLNTPNLETPPRYFVGRVCQVVETEGKRTLAIVRDEREPPRWAPTFIALDRLTVIP